MTSGICRSALISGFRECTERWVRLDVTSALRPAPPIFFRISALESWERSTLAATGYYDAIDLMYFRLGRRQCAPISAGTERSFCEHYGELFLLTPKVGIRSDQRKKINADVLAGIRYWYFGENLNFNPSALGLTFPNLRIGLIPMVGGRIEMAPCSAKTALTVAGDVGGWGTGSQLEYQVVGLLGYKLKPEHDFAGWVSLFVFGLRQKWGRQRFCQCRHVRDHIWCHYES